MKRILSIFCVIALVGTFCAACKNKPGKETGSVTIEYKIVNQIESDIVVELKFGDEQVMTIEPGDTQMIYSATSYYDGPVPPELLLPEKTLEAEMKIDEMAVPEEIWMYDNWDDNVENSGKDYLHTYTLTVTDELLEVVWPEKDTDIRPLTVSDEVSAFLDANLHLITRSIFGYAHESETPIGCAMLNSVDEFRAVVTSSVELPSIDFNKRTLIIGRDSAPDGSFFLESQSINNESEEKIKLILIIKSSGSGSDAPEFVLYWGLYPKLPQKPVSIKASLYTYDGTLLWETEDGKLL